MLFGSPGAGVAGVVLAITLNVAVFLLARRFRLARDVGPSRSE
jgi:hypothetical protein